MDMLKVSAAEFQRNIVRYQDLALRQPIAVTRNGRESCILLSTEEYRRLKRRDREVLGIDDFTEADAEAVRRAEPPAEAAAFDHELNP
jgi:PHD/YefM family antitoxin component YafN of YafNO toxin-antitoxin module